MTRAISFWGGALILAASALPVLATGPGPVPAFNTAATPLVKLSATRVGIRASSSSQSGYMSAAQASDLQFVLSGGLPTPTPVPTDPLNLTYGRLQSEGVTATYLADTFTAANVADISGRTLPTGGTTWGKWQSATRTIGIVSNAAAFTAGSGNTVYSAASPSSTTGAVVVSFNYAITSGQAGLFVRASGSDCSGYSIDFNGGSQIHIVQRDSACGIVTQSTDDSGGAYINAVGTLTVTLDGSTVSASWSQGGTASMPDVYPSRTRMGLWGTGGTINNYAFTNFSFATPSVPAGISLRGTYGTGYATETIGGTLGGFDFAFPANTGNNTFHQSVVLDSSMTSTVPTGTAPFKISSTTKSANMNVDLLDGLDSTAFALASSLAAYRGYLTLVGFLGVTNGSSDSGKITVDTNTLTPKKCTVELESLGTGAGTCVYSLYDVTTSTLMCSVSVACNSSTTTTGTCTASGTAAANDVLSFRSTSPSVGDTSAALSTLTCSFTQ